ncbi:MAG TPA: cytochrome c peroxidase [Flavobacteriales bacterium]
MKKNVLLVITLLGLLVAACRKDKEEEPTPTPPAPGIGTPYDLVLPSNLPPMAIPPDNPLTVEGVDLGRYLFYEERLSGDNTMSCSSCHAPAMAFTDGLAVSTGIDGIAGKRSSMPLFNLGYSQFFFWDGRAVSLEQQILEPVTNPIELHDTWPNAVSKLQNDGAYPALFNAAFGTQVITPTLVSKAIAQFLRTLVSGNSKYDKVVRGEDIYTNEEFQGRVLFEAEGGPVGQQIFLPGGGFVVGQGGADCFHCHNQGAGLFTDEQFHNNALDTEPFADQGRAAVTNDPFDAGKFKTPSLRNIMLTAPYMHDGRFATIDEVIDHYNDGGHSSSTADPFMKFTDPDLTLELTPQKREQLKAFLNALTDVDFVNNPAFQDPGPPVP